MGHTAFKQNRDLTQGVLFSRIVLFALPVIATSILQMLFNTADTIVVGRWGGDTKEQCEVALAAVGSCGALINLILNLVIGLSVGAGVTAAHDFGAKDGEGVQKTLHTSVFVALTFGSLFGLVGMLLSGPLLSMMGTDAEVLGQAQLYMCAYLLGAPAAILYNYTASIIRAGGDTARPLVFLTAAGIANVVLNLVTVTVFRLGAVGVGIATAVSKWVSAILMVIYLMRTDGPCHLDLKKLKVDRRKLKKIMAVGIPAGIQNCMFSLSNVIVQSSVNSFGKVTVAANTAATNIADYLNAIHSGFYQAAMNFTGQHVGAKRLDRIPAIALCCNLTVVTCSLLCGALLVFFGEDLLAIYAPGNEEIIRLGMIRLHIFAATHFIFGITQVEAGILRGLGKSFSSMMSAIIGTCFLRILWIYTVFASVHTLEALYVTYPISWIFTGTANLILAHFALKSVKRKQLAEAELVLQPAGSAEPPSDIPSQDK